MLQMFGLMNPISFSDHNERPGIQICVFGIMNLWNNKPHPYILQYTIIQNIKFEDRNYDEMYIIHIAFINQPDGTLIIYLHLQF